jgi:hypothetical protein
MATSEELAERRRFFEAALPPFIDEINRRAAPDAVVGRLETVEHVAACYFLISDAYKRVRVFKPDEHRTEPYKVAALTTAVLSSACLLEPRDPANVQSEWVALSNEYFSVYCACAILKSSSWNMPRTVLHRHYLGLQSMQLDVAGEFQRLTAKTPVDIVENHNITLTSRDLSTLDNLVNIYLGWWFAY